MKVTAADKRYANISRISHSAVMYHPDGNVWSLNMENRGEFAAQIRTLAPLGRTERWKGAIESWASALETAESESVLQWALFQYGIWATHAAD